MEAPALAHSLNARATVRLARGLPRVRRNLPRQQQPDLIRGLYLVELRHLLKPMKVAVEAAVYPLLPRLLEQVRAETAERQDAGEAARARVAIDNAARHYTDGLRDLRPLARRIGQETSDFQKRQLQRQLRAALTVEVPIRDPRIGARLEVFTEENVRLIESIPQRYFGEVQRLVLDAVSEGRRWENLAGDIEERWGVSQSRAELIARDQVGKFYSAIAKARQTDLGIKTYIWRTMRDERVREEHAAREGDTFEWKDPPEDGAPGEPVNCRCFADPDLEAVLDAL